MSEEIEVNERGGAGSKVPWYHLLDARALRELVAVLEYGARKYARDNWRACPVDEHVRHAIGHLIGWLEVEQQYPPEMTELLKAKRWEDLTHALCRSFMAVAVEMQDAHVADVVPRGLVTSHVVELPKRRRLDDPLVLISCRKKRKPKPRNKRKTRFPAPR